jgi:hypothetical protein
MEWFLQFLEQVKVWWAEPTILWLGTSRGNKSCTILGTSQSLVGSVHQTLTFSQNWRNHSVGNLSNQTHQQRRPPDRNTRLAQTLDRCNKAQWRLHWRLVNVFCKINSFLKRKHTVCRTSWNDPIILLFKAHIWQNNST